MKTSVGLMFKDSIKLLGILAVDHSVKFPAFLFKVVTLYDSLPQDLTLKYQPSDKDLNALIYVTNDNDLKHMMHEYVRLYHPNLKPKTRAFVAALNAEVRRTKGRLMDELPKLQKRMHKKVLVLTLPERIQVIPNGIYGAIVQTAGWTATSSQSHIKFDSSGLTRDGLSKNFFHRPSKAYTTGIRKRRKIQNEYDLQGAETRWHKTGKTRLVMVNGKQKGCKLSANCKLQVAICQLCT
ncbi:hypothetical protein JHK82_018357 [Glycine max]|nr:hypothetical protein JHK82_018357 [Glycine max]